ncbi:MAG: response regulator [Acetobacteraceae bacterium]|nr:response regulator [Acetobacteraceae bacterium]
MAAGRSHILVVEDDPLVSEVVAAALDDDYDTSLVETAAEAMECIGRGGIDLMLLDCTLPGGLDVRLIPQADQSGIPVILMSGDPARVEQIGDRQRPFVAKPFTLTTLLDTVERVMRAGSDPSA